MGTKRKILAGGALCALLALALAPAVGATKAKHYRPAVLDRGLAAKLATAVRAERFDAIVSAWDRSFLSALDRLHVRHRKLQALPMAFARLTPLQITSLLGTEGIRSVWAPRKFRPMLNEGPALMGARYVSDRLKVDGTGVTVAVIDSGVDTTHPDLPMGDKVLHNYEVVAPNVLDPGAPLVVDMANTDLDGHGTHVSGTIAGSGADAPEDKDYRGVAPGAKLIVYSADVGPAVTLLETHTTAAFDHIIANVKETGVRAISNSWGGADGFDYSPDDPTAIAQEGAYKAGIVVVFAAGNSGTPGDLAPDGVNTLGQQCVSPYVICVGAMTKHKQVVTFSSRGRPEGNQDRALAQRYALGVYRPTVTAPGVNITAPAALAAAPDSDRPLGYLTISGTSMATPHVTGVVALIAAANPGLTPAQIISIVESTADRLPGWDAHEAGAGAINARRAVEVALAMKAGRKVSLAPPRFDYAPPARSTRTIATVSGSALPASFIHHEGVETEEFTVPKGVERLQITLTWPTPAENLYAYIFAPGDEPGDAPNVAPFATQESWGLLCDDPLVGLGAPCTLTQRKATITYPEPGTWKMRVYGRTLATTYEATVEALTYAVPSVRAVAKGSVLSGTATFPAVDNAARTIGEVPDTLMQNPNIRLREVYFHGSSPLGNLDVVQGSDPGWDTTLPTEQIPKSSHGVYAADQTAAGQGAILGRFSGTLERAIEGDLLLQFWAGATMQGIFGAQWDIAILSGDKVLAQGLSEAGTLSEVPTRITAAVKNLRLAAGTPITIQIRAFFVNSGTHFAIYYDASSMPSGLVLPEVVKLGAARGALEVKSVVVDDLRNGAVRVTLPSVDGARSYRVYRGRDPLSMNKVATVAPASGPAKKLPPVVVEGSIIAGNPGTELEAGVTNLEFLLECTDELATQGADGYVIKLPEGAGDGLQTFGVTGSGAVYDLDVYFYNEDCSAGTGDIASEAQNESGRIPKDSAWAIVNLWSGVQVPFKATITRSAVKVDNPSAIVRGLTPARDTYFRVTAIDAKGAEGPFSNVVSMRPTALRRAVEVSLDGSTWIAAPLRLSKNGRAATWSVDVASLRASAVSTAAASKRTVQVRAVAGDAASAPVTLQALGGGGIRPRPILPATGVGAGTAGFVLLALAVAAGIWRRLGSSA